ncbi:MAG: biosynthetic-type acetolactate synthase large subunit [Prevotellaceae bacterium]|jgi:acetolactate synthase-1/2/3 large subunit|nr:biosynthetic-type acetolactate synthase large subunit [Prevotellaceae bacterium]
MSKTGTGAESLMLSLMAERVDTIFGYPGGAIMPVFDSMYDYLGKLNYILTRHEQGAVHAAQGYARVSGKVGVCIATSGPGATNLITGVADAMIDSTPLVCIVGQVGAQLLGTDAFQEADVVGISMPVTKWNYQITEADEVAEVIAKAFYVASSGRPGPVVLDFTKNAQIGKTALKEYKRCSFFRSYIPAPIPKSEEVSAAADLINAAKKPFALIGQGVTIANAEKEVVELLEKADIPFGWTLLGKSAVPGSHPLNMGMLGMHGGYAPNAKTNECDVLIAIGMRFDDRVTSDVKMYAPQAKVVHMEIDKAEISKNIKAHAPVLGNIKETVPMLVAKVHGAKHAEWIASFAPLYKEEKEKVIDKQLHPKGNDITMGEAINLFSEKTAGEAILVTDVGQQQMFAARYFNVNKPRSVVTSGGLGTMGFGLPSAIGAKVAAPDREVILFAGDGGIQMTIQELGTIMQSDIGVKIVILNNGYLGMVRQWQELFHQKRYSSTPLANPDFVMVAKAYSIAAKKVAKRDELASTIDEMLNHKGAYLLEIAVEAEDNVFPMVPAGAPLSSIRFE